MKIRPAFIARSDFATRDRCRRVVEESARQSKTTEWDVARLAVQLAQGAPRDTREGCVAFYLLDDGLPELEKRVGRRLPWREWRLRVLYRHPTLFYLGSFVTLTTGIVSAFLFAAHTVGVSSPLMLLLLGIFAVFPISELALYCVQMWLTWSLFRRGCYRKCHSKRAYRTDCRTLVVVPMMLLTPDSIRGEIEKLEVRYLANPMPNLCFSLLADFTDAEKSEMPEDDDLLGLAIKGIEQLNARYGDGTFHPLSQITRVVRDRAPLDRMGAETREAGGTQSFSKWRRPAGIWCTPERCRPIFVM